MLPSERQLTKSNTPPHLTYSFTQLEGKKEYNDLIIMIQNWKTNWF